MGKVAIVTQAFVPSAAKTDLTLTGQLCVGGGRGVGRGRERERERCSPFMQAVQIYPDLPLTEPVGRYILH